MIWYCTLRDGQWGSLGSGQEASFGSHSELLIVGTHALIMRIWWYRALVLSVNREVTVSSGRTNIPTSYSITYIATPTTSTSATPTTSTSAHSWTLETVKWNFLVGSIMAITSTAIIFYIVFQYVINTIVGDVGSFVFRACLQSWRSQVSVVEWELLFSTRCGKGLQVRLL